jgi:hypothetical protein
MSLRRHRNSSWHSQWLRGRKREVSECQGVRVSGCQGVRVSGCQGVRVSGCQGVRVSGCQGVRVSECQSVRFEYCLELGFWSLEFIEYLKVAAPGRLIKRIGISKLQVACDLRAQRRICFLRSNYAKKLRRTRRRTQTT